MPTICAAKMQHCISSVLLDLSWSSRLLPLFAAYSLFCDHGHPVSRPCGRALHTCSQPCTSQSSLPPAGAARGRTCCKPGAAPAMIEICWCVRLCAGPLPCLTLQCLTSVTRGACSSRVPVLLYPSEAPHMSHVLARHPATKSSSLAHLCPHLWRSTICPPCVGCCVP